MRQKANIRGTVYLLSMLIALAAMLTGCGGSSAAGTSTNNGGNGGGQAAGCVAVVKEINGVNTRQFCGSAKAQGTAGGQSISFSDGDCQVVSGQFTLNIGRIVLGITDAAQELKKQYNYFGVTLSTTKDGTFKNASIAFDYGGTGYALTSNTLVLSDNLTKGTFTGSDRVHGDASGSFTC